MERIFLRLVPMSLSAGWLVLAVMALRLLLRRAPRRIVCLLWALVALRLMFPVQIAWRASLMPSQETVTQTAQTTLALPADQMIAASRTAAQPAQDAAPSGASAERAQILCSVWLAGAGAMLLWAAVSDIRLRARLRGAVRLKDNIRLTTRIETPFVLGVVRPHIYLPDGLDPAQYEYVLAHERAHIARRDHIWKPLGWLLLSVYWFHPLLWAAYVLLCRDLELACDERVARGLDRAGLAAYAEALLDCGCRRRSLPASPVAFAEVGVKARVKAVLRYRRPVFLRVALALVTVAAAGALFLTEQPAKALPLVRALTVDAAFDPETGHPDDLPPAQTARPQTAETQTAQPQTQTAQTQTASPAASASAGTAPEANGTDGDPQLLIRTPSSDYQTAQLPQQVIDSQNAYNEMVTANYPQPMSAGTNSSGNPNPSVPNTNVTWNNGVPVIQLYP